MRSGVANVRRPHRGLANHASDDRAKTRQDSPSPAGRRGRRHRQGGYPYRLPFLVSAKNGRSRKPFSRSRAMTAPSASTVTRTRSAAARAARVRARASLRHRLASSSSSPRSTTSYAPCRAGTTMRASAVRASSLILQGLGVCQTNPSTQYMLLSAPIALHACVSSPFSLWSAHHPPFFSASSVLFSRRRCQRRASSALMAETAVLHRL